jgi:hypothetical protein
MGDAPYNASEWPQFTKLIDKINTLTPQPLFVVHVGDIRDGNEICSRPYLERIRGEFERLKAPWIYTPGDNEWVDCSLASEPDVYYDLADVRDVFFADPEALRNFQQLPGWRTQGAPIENQRWEEPGIVFVTTHLVYWQLQFAHPEYDPRHTDEKWFKRAEDQISLAQKEFFLRGVAASRWIEATSHLPDIAKHPLMIVFSQIGVPGCKPPGQPQTEPCAPTAKADNDTVGIGSANGFFNDWNTVAKGSELKYLFVHGDYHVYQKIAPMYAGNPSGAPNLFSLGVPGSPCVAALLVDVPKDVRSPAQLTVTPIGGATQGCKGRI